MRGLFHDDEGKLLRIYTYPTSTLADWTHDQFYEDTPDGSIEKLYKVFMDVSEENYQVKSKITGRVFNKRLGYRITIEIEFKLLNDDIYSRVVEMLEHIDYISNYENKSEIEDAGGYWNAVMIMPFYKFGVGYDESMRLYGMRLISDISPQGFSNTLQNGESLKLVFESNKLYQYIPKFELPDWTDEIDDFLVDDNGDNILFT